MRVRRRSCGIGRELPPGRTGYVYSGCGVPLAPPDHRLGCCCRLVGACSHVSLRVQHRALLRRATMPKRGKKGGRGRSSGGSGASGLKRRKGRESVHVVVRVRPINSTERGQGHSAVVTTNSASAGVSVPDHRVGGELKHFTFDAVYGPKSTQQEIYEQAAKPIGEGVLEGFNGTIFAYGQTGTGTSTHTHTHTSPLLLLWMHLHMPPHAPLRSIIVLPMAWVAYAGGAVGMVAGDARCVSCTE